MKITYNKNMGIFDRMIRVIIGIILIITGLSLITEVTGIVLFILSIPLLVTGITGFCPGYIPFGFSTNRKTGVVNNKI